MEIRPAKIEESDILTSISFQSKKYWGYPDHFFEVWKNELTISTDYIRRNRVFVFEDKRVIRGYYSIVYLENDLDVSGVVISKGHWLEHMFISPDFIGKGIGTKLFDHLKKICTENKITRIGILSDPNARGFYEKMGYRYIKEYPSTIPNRTTPFLVLMLQPE
ncbi:MAG: GNAT family N-acetyltransferase [Desulfobacula sp.]|jgi:GNAT superfamily N-acetyltransferase